MTSRVVAVLGTGVIKPDEPVLAADDLGLTRGDGCFEATRVTTTPAGEHRIDHLEEHLERLQASSHSLELPDVDAAAWRALIAEVLAEWDLPGETMLKLMITRGRESHPEGPITGIATLTPLSETALRQRRDGISVVTLMRGTTADVFESAPWLLGGVKTLSYAINVAAGRVAAARGADDVLFASADGWLLEGPTSAVVWWHGDRLYTTPVEGTGILASITQRAVFAAAAEAGVGTEYRLGSVADLHAADGAWLVSSGRGTAAIRSLDGTPLAVSGERSAQLARWAGFQH